MSFRNIVRNAAVCSNPHWPFSSINRLPYSLAVEAFVKICQSYPEITDAYVRHGFAGDDWIPGISDIDLTVVTYPHESAEAELAFLAKFWSAYGRLKKVFPMLGEVLLLQQNFLDVWSRFSICGFETTTWRSIYGRTPPVCRYRASAPRIRLDAFNYASAAYKRFFSSRELSDSAVSLLSAGRLILKIRRYANYGAELGHQENAYELVRNYDAGEMNELAVAALRPGLRCIEKILDSIVPENSDGQPNRLLPPEDGTDLSRFTNLPRSLVSIISGHRMNIVVLQDDLTAAEITSAFCAIKSLADTLGADPLIVELSLFKYLLRVQNPFLFSGLRSYGRRLTGADPLPNITPPHRDFLNQRILEQAAYVLRFPSDARMQRSSLQGWLTGGEPFDFFWRALFIKFLLETGEIDMQFHHALTAARQRFPEMQETFSSLQRQAAATDDEGLRLAAFSFFRQIAQEVADGLRDYMPSRALYPY